MNKHKKILKDNLIDKELKAHKSFLFDLIGITAIPGIDIKTAAYLYISLKIQNIFDLYQVCKNGELKNTKGFSEKKQEDIKNSIELLTLSMMGRCNKVKKELNSPYQPKVVDKLFLMKLAEEISKNNEGEL
jgi:DNA polymerase/3'-5' exonuclease PolX